jgi:hypothetical protein
VLIRVHSWLRVCALLLACSASAQWLKVPTPGAPRTPDGKVNLTAPAPRAPDGKPDLSGVWQTNGLRFLTSLDADGIQVPMRPWARAAFMQSQANHGKDDPDAHCTPPGVPRINVVPDPFKILPMPGVTVILYEAFTTFRQVFTDGRPLPKDPNPDWLGYSVGKWEGDDFVVDSIGFNDLTWLDNAGHPHSEALHVTERFRRRDYGHMGIAVTIDDPKAYLRPWSVNEDFILMPDTDVLEFVCTENNRDLPHLVGK